MSEILELIDNLATVTFLICFIVNTFLIYLTHFAIKRNFGPYKWLISSFSMYGIIFAAIEYVATPIMHNFNAGCAFFTVKSIFGASNLVKELLLALCCGVFSSAYSSLAIQFIYRYFAIFSPHNLTLFNGMKVFLWICYPLLSGLILALSAVCFTLPDNFTTKYFENAIYEYYGESLTAHLAVIVYDEVNFSQPKIHWKSCYYSLAIFLIVSIQYSIMIYCGYYMNREIKSKTAHISRTFRRLHRQFFKALVLQLVLPSALFFFPITVITGIPFLDYKINFSSGVLVALISIYPAVDAFILIYIVSDYSKAVKGL